MVVLFLVLLFLLVLFFFRLICLCNRRKKAGGGVDNKTVKLALATLFLNFAVASHQEPLTPGGDLGDAYQQLVALYSEVAGAVTAAFADDALYRVLAGLGTLVTVRASERASERDRKR